MWITVITLLMSRMPQLIDLWNEMQANGQSEPTEAQIAKLGLSEDDLQAAINRLYPPPA